MPDPLGIQFSFLSAQENGALGRAVITGHQEVWKAWPETVEEHYVDAAQRGVMNAGFTPGRLAEKAVEFIEREAAAYREVLEKLVKPRADGLGADAADEVDAACARRAQRRCEQVLAGLRDRVLRNHPLRDHPGLLASCRETLEKGTARAYRHVAAQVRLEMFVTPERLRPHAEGTPNGHGHDPFHAESSLGRIVAELKAETQVERSAQAPRSDARRGD